MKKKIQIFKAGTYGENSNRIWNEDEVKQLKDNYDFNYRRAMVKLGHDGFFDSEKPAVGWVESLEINDNGILEANVNFNDDDVKNIKDKYINVSVEVVKHIEEYDLGQTDLRGAYLLGVVLLGSSQPEVAGLEPVKFSKNEDDKSIGIMTGLGIETSSFEKDLKNDNITQNKHSKGENAMDLEKIKAEAEKFRKQNEELQAKLQEFEKAKREADLVSFFEANKTKVIPAVKEDLVEFAKTLNDTQLENFKKIVEKMPELEAFKKVEFGAEPETKTEKNVVEEALADLEAFKKIN